MHCRLLASTALIAFAAPAMAETIATDITQPVRTSTIKNGTADSISITDAGSVTVTGGTAVTMDSDHAVSNAGDILVNNADGARGIVALAGTSGQISNTGSIKIGETYTPTDTDNDGDLDGPFAIGSDRYGIRTLGAHTGNIVNDGTIAVKGNNSGGIRLDGALDGNFTHNGTTTVLGDASTAIRTDAIAGNVRLAGTVTATGAGSVGAQFAGDVDGAMVVQGNITATGYRKTAAPADPSKLDADDLLQGGSALLIEGDVSGGILLAIAPKDTNASDKDEDDDGIDDDKEGSANIVSYGAAPAMVVGASGRDIAVGAVAASGSKFGLLIDGKVSGQGVYSGADGNGLLIGGRGGAVTIANGIGIAGTVSATSKDAQATALRLGAAGAAPQLQVSGTVNAASGNAVGATATAIRVDAGASLPAIRNSGTIKAAVGASGTATAILDAGGTVALVENSGTISATGAASNSGRNIAIDLSANSAGASVMQTQVAAGFTAPSIVGDIRFGSGDDSFSVADGTVTGDVAFGSGSNTLALSGDALQTGKIGFGAGNDAMGLAGSSAYSGTVDFGGGSDTLALGGSARFTGRLVNAAGLAVSVNSGTLDVAQPATIGALDVRKDGTLVVTLDKAAGEGTAFTVAGTASFEAGATLGIRLADVHDAEGRYVVLEAGNLVGGAGIKPGTAQVPYMFKATLAADAAPNQLALDIAKRTTTELGLNRSQAAAYGAVFDALANDDDIEAVFLGITDGDQFRDSVALMLPDHAGGAFQGVSQGVRTFARQVAEPIGPVYDAGGLNIVLNAAGWGANKDQGETAAYDLNGLGFSAASEIETGLGQLGLSGSWLWNEYTSENDNNKVIANTYELAAYWRGNWGGFGAFGRAAIGKVNFDGRRTFTGNTGDEAIQLDMLRDWNGTVTSFSGGASYEGGGRHFFFRPAVSVDYVRLKEDGYSDTGGNDALNLTVEERLSDELAVNGGLTLGVDFSGNRRNDSNWFRLETEGGWREIVGGALGSTTAHFKNGDSFTLDPEQVESGWYAALRALGGVSDFSLSGELAAEDRLGGTAFSIRGSLRMNF